MLLRNYYLDVADVVSNQCTCFRRRYGAVIVKNDEIISTGYVGAPRGRQNCTDVGYCIRQKLNIPRGERYELCRSVHAEANAIISVERAKLLLLKLKWQSFRFSIKNFYKCVETEYFFVQKRLNY